MNSNGITLEEENEHEKDEDDAETDLGWANEEIGNNTGSDGDGVSALPVKSSRAILMGLAACG